MIMNESSGASLIDLQIMWHRLIAVVEEQAQVLLRTAFSPIVRECGDLSAGVFDLKGRMRDGHAGPRQFHGRVGQAFHRAFPD
jgi:N-methylhydantoinase B